MDVMKPPLFWIGNMCYRRNPAIISENDNTEMGRNSRPQQYNDFEEPCDDEEDDVDIRSIGEKFETSLDIPPSFFKFVIGKKGEAKRKIEEETRCTIHIPRLGAQGPIVINGRDKQKLKSARTRIEVIVDSARQRLPATHFAALPVTAANVVERFECFKKEVLQRFGKCRGVDATVFQSSPRLHLTFAVFVLGDKNEESDAAAIFKNCATQVVRSLLQNEPLTARVQGLQCMNDDPASVDVLYAKIVPSADAKSEFKVQKFVDMLSQKLVSAGVARREQKHVKLHLTLMNSAFRQTAAVATKATGADSRSKRTAVDEQRPGSAWQKRESFDATAILKEYGDYDFGELRFESVYLCIRGTTSRTDSYESVDVVQLP